MNILSILIFWTTFCFYVTNAHPQIQGGLSDFGDDDTQNDGEIRIFVNENNYTMPFFDYYAYNGYPIEQTDVETARIENAPPGYGCFFITSNDDSFISQPFYSASTAGYRSDLFEPLIFESAFPAAVYLMCFRLPNPAASPPMSQVVLDIIPSAGERTLRFEAVLHYRRLASIGIGNNPLPSGTTLARAAVVQASRRQSSCVAKSKRFGLGDKRFAKDSPLLSTVENFREVVCANRR